MSTEQEKFVNTSKDKGSFVRPPTKFHDEISRVTGAKFPPEAGRYRLYVSYACPWAHRTLIMRKLKGLEKVISVTVTNYTLPHLAMDLNQSDLYSGWEFISEKDPSSIFHEPHGFETLAELYELAHPGYRTEAKANKQRPVFSVPVLFDEKTQKIVTNESSEIIVMLNTEFNNLAENPELDLNPEDLREEMKKMDAIVYPGINDGVYRCGFSKTQRAYKHAYEAHWKAMDQIETVLSKQRYLTGERMTLSDIRLFVTLIRYDAVYYSHFKTSRNLIQQLPSLLRFTKDLYNTPGVAETVNIEFIVKHYYESQRTVNPTGIWPMGPLQPGYLDYLKETSSSQL